MADILIIEDDSNINNMICEFLGKNGFSCTQAFSGTEGLLHTKMKEYSLILLDLMLPGIDGAQVTKQIREFSKTPIIIISAKDELDSKVDLLTLGADDYLTKPFETAELLARVNVQLRHTTQAPVSQTLSYGGLSLDKDTFQAVVDDVPVNLTRQEYKILELLISYPKKVFSKADIYGYAWDDYYIGEDKTINVHISNIRQKLKKINDNEYIDTVWGIGFKLHT